MGRHLDFARSSRNRQARFALSVKDEAEWMENDAAARWLRRNAKHIPQIGRLLNQLDKPTMHKLAASNKPKRRHADLDPHDPHDQLLGVDTTRLPWK
jgi:hypothetical protein